MPDNAGAQQQINQLIQQHGGLVGLPAPVLDPKAYGGDASPLIQSDGSVSDPYYEYHFADGYTIQVNGAGQVAPGGIKAAPKSTVERPISITTEAPFIEDPKNPGQFIPNINYGLKPPTTGAKSPAQAAADLAETTARTGQITAQTAQAQAATANQETPAERAQRAAAQEAAATGRTAMTNQAAMDRIWADSQARSNEARDKIKADLEAGIILPKQAELQLTNMYETEKARVQQEITQENARYQSQLDQGNKAYDYQLNGPRQDLQAKTTAAEAAAKPYYDQADKMLALLQEGMKAGIPWDEAFSKLYFTPFQSGQAAYADTMKNGLQPVTPPAPAAVPPPPSLGAAPVPATAATGTTSAPAPVATATAPADAAPVPMTPDQPPKPEDEEDQ